jgi:asparagine synthase (glutamine-hydrolysing)
MVPSEVIYRPKMGFAMPLPRWFQAEIGLALERLLKESVAERLGWIDAGCVLRELEDHRSGIRDNHARLWLILWLELWFRVVVSGEMDRRTDLAEALGLCVS